MRHPFLLPAFTVALAFSATAQPTPVSAPKLALVKTTDLAAHATVGAVGAKVALRATLTSKADGKPLAGKVVTFRVAGKDSGKATTGPTGEARLEYTVPNDPPPGPHPMEAKFEGDAEWAPAFVTANFDVVKAETKLRFPVDTGAGPGPPKGVNEGESVRMVGQLTRKGDGANVDGRVIVVTVNGERKARLTTSGGFFTFDWTAPKAFAPKATVQAQFEGDVLYLPNAATSEFAVHGKARAARAVVTSAAGTFGDTVTLKVLLLESGPIPKPIGGQKLGVQIFSDYMPYGRCEGITNEIGEATCRLKLNMTPGAYVLYPYALDVDQGVWTVDTSLDPSSSAYLNVSQAPTHLAVSGPAAAQIGQKVSLKATLTLTKDHSPIAGEAVGAAGGRTDASGNVTVEIRIPSVGTGPKAFKVTYPGSVNYTPSEGTVTIDVKPSTK